MAVAMTCLKAAGTAAALEVDEHQVVARLAILATDAPIPYRAQNGGDYDDDLVLKAAPGGEAAGLTATRLRPQS